MGSGRREGRLSIAELVYLNCRMITLCCWAGYCGEARGVDRIRKRRCKGKSLGTALLTGGKAHRVSTKKGELQQWLRPERKDMGVGKLHRQFRMT